MILNYENELVSAFGQEEGLADRLRFPVFVSSITPEGVEAIKSIRAKLPARTLKYINDFHDGLDAAVAEDARFEFRVHLVPQLGPKNEADLAVNFVQLKDIDPTLHDALERLGKTGLVAKHVKREPVHNLGRYKPQAVVDRVAAEVAGFNMSDHTSAWKESGVRPPYGADDPAATDSRYVIWDEPHGDYLYTEAWVKKLIREAKVAYEDSIASTTSNQISRPAGQPSKSHRTQ